MFNRTLLPILKQRSPAVRIRPLISTTQARFYAKSRKINDYQLPPSASRPEWQEAGHSTPRYPSNTPLRPVRPSPNERIDPQPTERISNLKSPVAGPDESRLQQGIPKQDHESDSHPSKTSSSIQQSSETLRSSSSPQAESESSAEQQQQDAQPLPDLTKGIPSTLEAEFRQAHREQGEVEDKTNITEDSRSPPPGPGGRGGGELPHSAYISSSDRKRSLIVRFVYLGLTVGITSYILYQVRDWDTEEEAEKHPEAPNGYSPGAMYNRIRARFGTTVSYYSDPVTTKLLPDEETDPNVRRPFVLVLSLEDFLVHSEWSRQNGYRIAKRPGVDYFLRYLSLYYELVLFTSQPDYIAQQVWGKLDPYRNLRFLLSREHTLYRDGGYIKDLSYMNRDLSKVIIMDTDAHHVHNQPENAIVLPKWTGDPNDQTLIQYIPFLEYIATLGVKDVRQVLKSFEGKHIPTEFARRQQQMREKYEKEQGGKNKSRSGKGFGLGSLLGASQPLADGQMPWDRIREQGQKLYEENEKFLKEEGPKWLAEQEAMEKQAQEEFKQSMKSSMKSGMFGWFGVGQSAADEKK